MGAALQWRQRALYFPTERARQAMWLLVGLGIVVLLGVPFFLSLGRATELFVLEVRKGQVSVLRGRLPDRLLDELRDVLRRAASKQGEVKTVVSQGRPRVMVSGDIDENALQQLRNVVGRYDTAQIRAAKRSKRNRARRA